MIRKTNFLMAKTIKKYEKIVYLQTLMNENIKKVLM